MPGIENLNFQVILDYKQFNKDVAEVKKIAKGLNFEVSQALDLKKKISAADAKLLVNAEKVRQAEEKTAQQAAKTQTEKAKTAIQEQKLATEAERTRRATEGTSGAVAKTNVQLSSTTSIMRVLSQLTGTAFSVIGIRRFLSSLIDITGQFEVQKMALRNMLQDIDAADKIYQDLYRFSSDSTYRFSELAKYAKQLAAFNIPKEDLLETTKMLGDVASGVGVSMDRIILAYGHVKSSGFLRGIQLRSFAQNGVPVLEELAKQFSEIEHRAVGLGEIFDKMMRREIPFEMVEEAFRRMTSEGGKFYQMQEVLAKTLAGQINILKGRWENLLAAMGQANEGILKGTVQALSNMVSSTENFSKAIKSALIGIGAYETAMILAAVATGNMAIATTGLTGAVSRLFGALVKNPWTIVAAGVALAAIELYKFRTQVDGLTKIHQAAQKAVNDFNSATKTEIAELDALYAKLKYAEKGTKEYDTAKLALQSRFGPYIDELRAEGVEVENLTTLYEGLETKIKSAAAQRYREAATHDITTAYGEATGKIERVFNHLVKNMENGMGRALTAMEKEGLWQRMTGGINDSNISQWAALQPGLRKGMEASAGISTITDANILSYMREAYGIAGLEANITTVHAAFDALRVAWKKLSDQYVEDTNNATAAFNAFITQQEEGAPDAAKITTVKIGDIVTAIKNLDTQITALREKAKKEGLLVNLEENIDEEQQLKNLVTERKQLANQYEEIMGIKYDRQTKNDEKDQERADREAIQALKQQIGLLETYLSIYRKMESQMGADGAATWMSKMFGGDASKYKTLETQITDLTEKLREYGEAGKMAAYQEEARLGLGKAGLFEKQAKAEEKALKDYEAAEAKIAEYLSKNFGVEGEKVAGKISKILTDLHNKYATIDANTAKMVSELDKEKAKVVADYLKANKEGFEKQGMSEEDQKKLADAYWDEYKKRREKQIKDQAKAEKGYYHHGAYTSIIGQAKALFDQQMFGYDLSHWGDKTLSQILEIEDALKNLKIPQDVREELEGNKDALEALKKELKALAESALQKTVTPEKWKKVAEITKDVSSNVASLSDSLEGLGDAMNDSGIKGFASALKTASSYANTISDAFTGLMQASANGAEWGGVWGFIIAFGTQFLSTIIDLTAKSQQEAAALRDRYKEVGDAIKEAYHNSQIENFADALERAGDSLFGDNALARVARATRELQSLREQIAAMSSIAGFTTISQNGVNYGSISLEAAARQSGMALYDENNNYNAKLLNWIKDQGWDLTEEELDWLNRQIELSTNYAKALETVEDALSNLVDKVASDAADAIIDQWVEAGNAALDYADILDDVARSYAKMLIQNTILSKYLDPITSELTTAFKDGNYDEAMRILAGAMERIQNAAPEIEGILRAFDPYFKSSGDGLDSDSSSVGKGIKSITEETASLLASYLNAIRADVSYMRSMAESGWLNVENIARAITPNLADYVQQIAANTYNTAETTAAILSELQSVIGAPGATSPAVIRVEMA